MAVKKLWSRQSAPGPEPERTPADAAEYARRVVAEIQRDMSRAPSGPVFEGWSGGATRELLVSTGLRIGEAVALEWADVDTEALTIRVSRSRKVGGKLGGTKTDQARIVHIGPRTAEVLEQHRRASKAGSVRDGNRRRCQRRRTACTHDPLAPASIDLSDSMSAAGPHLRRAGGDGYPPNGAFPRRAPTAP
jgi:integrase